MGVIVDCFEFRREPWRPASNPSISCFWERVSLYLPHIHPDYRRFSPRDVGHQKIAEKSEADITYISNGKTRTVTNKVNSPELTSMDISTPSVMLSGF